MSLYIKSFDTAPVRLFIVAQPLVRTIYKTACFTNHIYKDINKPLKNSQVSKVH